MALRISEQRLRLVPDPPPARDEAAQHAPAADTGSDDDRPAELSAPFPGEEPAAGPGDFYADAMETV
jgi:hypothetical protein